MPSDQDHIERAHDAVRNASDAADEETVAAAVADARDHLDAYRTDSA